jgi:hypothetical protein
VAGDSAGSLGSSRGTGSSSGSTVYVRSGLPISTSSPDPSGGLYQSVALVSTSRKRAQPQRRRQRTAAVRPRGLLRRTDR